MSLTVLAVQALRSSTIAPLQTGELQLYIALQLQKFSYTGSVSSTTQMSRRAAVLRFNFSLSFIKLR